MSENPSYEEVLQAYKNLQIQTRTNDPDELDLDDPKVQEVHNMFYDWKEKANANDPEINFKMTVLLVDAGFNAPEYLDEVANDFLLQDLVSIERALDIGNHTPEENKYLEKISNMIKAKRMEINSHLFEINY